MCECMRVSQSVCFWVSGDGGSISVFEEEGSGQEWQ